MSKSLKFKIRPSMITGFLTMSLLLVILGLISIFYASRMQNNTRRIIEENVSSLKAAEELEIALLDMKGLTANYMLRREQRWLDSFAEKKATFLYWLSEAKKKTYTAEEVEITLTIDRLFSDYLQSQNRVIEQIQNNAPGAYELLTLEMLYIFDRIFEKCEELLLINEKLMFNTSSLIEHDNRTMNYLVIGMGVAGILSGLGLGLLLSQRIIHPIYNLVLRLRGASQGEVVQKIDIADLSELEHLDEYVHRLIVQVNKVNKDLEQSQSMLMRSEKLAALGKMTAGLAHEIRNPLTAIKMLMFSIQNEPNLSPQVAQDVSVIISEIGRIETFLQDFLDFARPSSPNLASNDFNKIITQTLNLLSMQIKSKSIQVDFNKEMQNGDVYVDEEQMQQVMVNMLLNSIQAVVPGGHICIRCRETAEAAKSPMFQIDVIDDGPGIPENLMSNLFDPFITGKEDGTGLGLSIAVQIVHNHGGWINAENAPGGGAKFTIHLPIKRGVE